MTYWGAFGINGLALISAGSILQSAIYQILLALLSTVVGLYIIHNGIGKLPFMKKMIHNKTPTSLGGRIVAVFFQIILIVVTVCFFSSDSLVIAFFLGNIIYSLIDEDKVFSIHFRPTISKDFLWMFIIYMPCVSISTALDDSRNVLNNNNYQFTVVNDSTKNLCNDTLKLIGVTNEYFVFSNARNTSTFYLKPENLKIESKNADR